MKSYALPLLLAALPLFAGDRRMEVGLVLGQAQARSFGITPSSFGITRSERVDPSNPTTLGLRLGIDVARAGNSDFQVTATWQPKAKADLLVTSDGSYPGGSYHYETKAKYGYGYLAVGGRFTWKVPVELGLGLELRSENVEFSENLVGDESPLTRPWLTFHLGRTWTGVKVSPFFRVEMALAMTKASAPDPNGDYSADDFIKPTAPNSHLMLIGGFRF